MLFNSFAFFIFLPIVVLVYYLLPHRFRWILLLLASYTFYGFWRVEYLGLILLSTVVDYWAGVKMDALPDKKQRKPWLWLSLVVNLGVLFFFKYFWFFGTSFASLFNLPPPAWNLLLPVGISYYTFQTLSYSIDVYRGDLQAEKRFGHFALFVAFFPQLVAGPIERAGNLLPQFNQPAKFKYEPFRDGLKQIGLGLFKKMVLADNLGMLADPIMDSPGKWPGPALALGAVLFSLQIWLDFSGYCSIAIGTAQLLGIRLRDNFNLPYQAISFQEIWSRWNITLSNWFRDYVYIPLGGNRVSKPRWVMNVMLTFLVSGLWHGANWTFLVWGGLHGVFYLFSVQMQHFWKRFKDNKTIRFVRNAGVFAGFTFAFVFFRSRTVSDGFQWTTGLFSAWSRAGFDRVSSLLKPHWPLLILLFILILLNQLIKKEDIRSLFSEKHWAFRWSFYLFIVLSIAIAGNFGQKPFIYFQF